ncbi:MAG TPA: TerC family protein [Firmicutes bacterium]|nr:TerC family protein [Bacillota bacterium]
MVVTAAVASLGKIIMIDLSLSGDNAAVIGLAVRRLPPKQARVAAILGAAGAIFVRVLSTVLLAFLMRLPYANAAGGLILGWITWKLAAGSGEGSHRDLGADFWGAVWAIVLADISTGFDNMMAVAGAAHGNALLVVVGLAISMPLLIWGSTWVARLMNRYPFVIFVGAAILAHTALGMIIEDTGFRLGRYLGVAAVFAPWVAAFLVAGWGWFRCRRRHWSGNEEARGRLEMSASRDKV